MGFLISGALAFMVAFPMAGFPESPPGSEHVLGLLINIRSQHKSVKICIINVLLFYHSMLSFYCLAANVPINFKLSINVLFYRDLNPRQSPLGRSMVDGVPNRRSSRLHCRLLFCWFPIRDREQEDYIFREVKER